MPSLPSHDMQEEATLKHLQLVLHPGQCWCMILWPISSCACVRHSLLIPQGGCRHATPVGATPQGQGARIVQIHRHTMQQAAPQVRLRCRASTERL